MTGAEGVGGILGSTRVKGSPSESYVYNNAVMRHCRNSGSVSSDLFVGGIAGEAQFGCYGALNEGPDPRKELRGRHCRQHFDCGGHNAINTGAVEGTDYVSGIIGKTGFGSVALNHNYGNISASGSHTAGILGLGGNNTIIHYCGNFGDISNPSGKYIGGIVGEIGDPREMDGYEHSRMRGRVDRDNHVGGRSVHSRGGARCWLGVPYGRHGDQDFGIRFRPCPKCHGCRLMVDRGCRAGLPRDP